MLHRSTFLLRMLPACFWLLFTLVVPMSSHADIALSFIPIEEAKFLIKGEGYEGVVSIHLTIDYDATYLTDPQVTVMGGKLNEGARGSTVPGRLLLDILNEEHSPVFEACVFFQKQGDYPAVINFVMAEVTDPAGARQPVLVAMMANPNAP
jgi:hypothetical protein